jgi:hypothetical protein
LLFRPLLQFFSFRRDFGRGAASVGCYVGRARNEFRASSDTLVAFALRAVEREIRATTQKRSNVDRVRRGDSACRMHLRWDAGLNGKHRQHR